MNPHFYNPANQMMNYPYAYQTPQQSYEYPSAFWGQAYGPATYQNSPYQRYSNQFQNFASQNMMMVPQGDLSRGEYGRSQMSTASQVPVAPRTPTGSQVLTVPQTPTTPQVPAAHSGKVSPDCRPLKKRAVHQAPTNLLVGEQIPVMAQRLTKDTSTKRSLSKKLKASKKVTIMKQKVALSETSLLEEAIKTNQSKEYLKYSFPTLNSTEVEFNDKTNKAITNLFGPTREEIIDLSLINSKRRIAEGENQKKKMEFIAKYLAIARYSLEISDQPINVNLVVTFLTKFLAKFPHMKRTLAEYVLHCSVAQLDIIWKSPPSQETPLTKFQKSPYILLARYFSKWQVDVGPLEDPAELPENQSKMDLSLSSQGETLDEETDINIINIRTISREVFDEITDV